MGKMAKVRYDTQASETWFSEFDAESQVTFYLWLKKQPENLQPDLRMIRKQETKITRAELDELYATYLEDLKNEMDQDDVEYQQEDLEGLKDQDLWFANLVCKGL